VERDYIVKTVNEALSEEFELDPADLTPEAHIRDDLNLDSLDIVDMIMALEQAFNFKLEDRSKILEIVTLGDVYAFIEKIYQSRVDG
jgi:acyl carrier protein